MSDKQGMASAGERQQENAGLQFAGPDEQGDN